MVATGRQEVRRAPPRPFIPISLLTPRGEIVPRGKLGGPAFAVTVRPSYRRVLRTLIRGLIFTGLGIVLLIIGFIPSLAGLMPGDWQYFAGVVLLLLGLPAIVSGWLLTGRRLRMRFEGDQVDLRLKSRLRTRRTTLPLSDFQGVQHRAYFMSRPDQPHLHTVELVHRTPQFTLPFYVGLTPPAGSSLPDSFGQALEVTVLTGIDIRDISGDGSGAGNSSGSGNGGDDAGGGGD